MVVSPEQKIEKILNDFQVNIRKFLMILVAFRKKMIKSSII